MLRIRLFCVLIATIILSACESQRVAAPPDVGNRQLMLLGVAPPQSSDDSAAVLEQVARTLARALASPSIRTELHAELQRSTTRENKLHLQRFLAASGQSLGRKVDSVSGPWTRTVVQLTDLELYLPVRELGGANRRSSFCR
jgi:hypothetical protein